MAEGGQFDLEAYKAKLLAELKSRQGDEGGGGGGGSDRIDNEERHQYYDDIQVRSLTINHFYPLSLDFMSILGVSEMKSTYLGF